MRIPRVFGQGILILLVLVSIMVLAFHFGLPTGKVVESSATFRVTLVEINITLPVDNTKIADPNITVNFDITNIGSGDNPAVDSEINQSTILVNISDVLYRVGGVPPVNCGVTAGVNLSCTLEANTTPEGTHTIKVKASDNAANPQLLEPVITVLLDNTRPYVKSVEPNRTNVHRRDLVYINFSERMNTTTLIDANIQLKNESGDLLRYDIDYINETNTSVIDPFFYFDNNVTFTVNISGVKDFAGNAIAGEVVWNFTTGAKDTDRDGIADEFEDGVGDDRDNDGVLNNVDKLNGFEINVNGDLHDDLNEQTNMSTSVGGDTNLAQTFAGLHNVTFYNASNKIFDMTWNFSTELDLVELKVNMNEEEGVGSVAFSGIGGSGETVFFVDRVGGYDGVCIKPGNFSSVEDISSTCQLPGELFVNCTGINDVYGCEIVHNVSGPDTEELKITGLKSGVIEQQNVFVPPEVPTPGPGTEGGGGVGPGGPAAPVCNRVDECTDWGECDEDELIQTRECEKVNDCTGVVYDEWTEERVCDVTEELVEQQTYGVEGFPDVLITVTGTDADDGTAGIRIGDDYEFSAELMIEYPLDLNGDGIYDINVIIQELINETHALLSFERIKASIPEFEEIGLIIEEPRIVKAVEVVSYVPLLAVILMLLLVSGLKLREIERPSLIPKLKAFDQKLVELKLAVKQHARKRMLQSYNDLRLMYEDIVGMGVTKHQANVRYEEIKDAYYSVINALTVRIWEILNRGRVSQAEREYKTVRKMYLDVLKEKLSPSKKFKVYTETRQLYYEIQLDKAIKAAYTALDKGKVMRATALYEGIMKTYHMLLELHVNDDEKRRLYSRTQAVYAEVNYYHKLIDMKYFVSEKMFADAIDAYRKMGDYYKAVDKYVEKGRKKKVYDSFVKSYSSLYAGLISRMYKLINRKKIIEGGELYKQLHELHYGLKKSGLGRNAVRPLELMLQRTYESAYDKLVLALHKKRISMSDLAASYNLLNEIYADIVQMHLSKEAKDRVNRKLEALYEEIFESSIKVFVEQISRKEFESAKVLGEDLARMYDKKVRERYVKSHKEIIQIIKKSISDGKSIEAMQAYNIMHKLSVDVKENSKDDEVHRKVFAEVIKHMIKEASHGHITEAEEVYEKAKEMYKQIAKSDVKVKTKKEYYQDMSKAYIEMFKVLAANCKFDGLEGNLEKYSKLKELYTYLLTADVSKKVKDEMYGVLSTVFMRLFEGSVEKLEEAVKAEKLTKAYEILGYIEEMNLQGGIKGKMQDSYYKMINSLLAMVETEVLGGGLDNSIRIFGVLDRMYMKVGMGEKGKIVKMKMGNLLEQVFNKTVDKSNELIAKGDIKKAKEYYVSASRMYERYKQSEYVKEKKLRMYYKLDYLSKAL